MFKYNISNIQLFAKKPDKSENPINSFNNNQNKVNKGDVKRKEKNEHYSLKKIFSDEEDEKTNAPEIIKDKDEVNEDGKNQEKEDINESPEVMNLKFRIRELEEINKKLDREKAEIEKGFLFKENITKLKEKYEDFSSFEDSILKKVDSSVIEVNGLKIKYLYEGGYDGLVAAYNMCKYSFEELPDINEYIEKNLDKITCNEMVKTIVIENYLKDVDEMKVPLVFKDDDGYTSYTKKEEPKNFADAAKLFLKSLE